MDDQTYNSVVSFIWGIANIRALEAEIEELLDEVPDV
jgi:hypothetical protein